MAKTFKYGKMDRRTRKLTVMWFCILAVILFLVWFFWGEGGYMPAWIISIFGAVSLLYLMSIPRKIVVGDTALEIRCVVEITHLKYSELRSIRRINSEDMKKRYVFFGSYGFFGYYGYYLDINRLEFIKLYCKELDNLVEIMDEYEKIYIVSTPQPDALIEAVTASIRYYSDSNEID